MQQLEYPPKPRQRTEMNKKYPDDFMQFVIKNYRPLDEAVKWLKKETQLKWTKEALLQGLEKVAAKPLHPSKILIAYANKADIKRGYDTEPVGLARLDRAEIENLLISELVVTKKVMYSGIPTDDIWVDQSGSLEECFGYKEFLMPTPITLDCVLIDIKTIEQIIKNAKDTDNFSWPISLKPEKKLNDVLISKIIPAIKNENEDPTKLKKYPKDQSVKSKIRDQFSEKGICDPNQFDRAWEQAMKQKMIIYEKVQKE